MELKSTAEVLLYFYEIFTKHLSTETSSLTRLIFLPTISLLGVANRLRIIASIVAIARLHRGHLFVPWFRDSGCNASFHSLFTLSPTLSEFITVVDVQLPSDSSSLLFEDVKKMLQAVTDVSKQPWLLSEPNKFFLSQDSFTTYNATAVFTRAQHALEGMNSSAYLESKRWFYTGLTPGPAVKAIVMAARARISHLKSMLPASEQSIIQVGLHIRMHDAFHDWAMVPPPSATGMALTFASSVTNSALQCLAHLRDNYLTKQPNKAVFFLASNNMQVKYFLYDFFGEFTSVTILSPELVLSTRHAEASVSLAAAEFFLLSQSDLIIHSHASSFAREAAMVGLVPVLDLMEDDKKCHFVVTAMNWPNSHLVQHALPEYIRQQILQRKEDGDEEGLRGQVQVLDKVCYAEFGGRAMCSLRYPVCACAQRHQHLSDQNQDPIEGQQIQWMQDLIAYCPVTVHQWNHAANQEDCLEVIAESTGHSI